MLTMSTQWAVKNIGEKKIERFQQGFEKLSETLKSKGIKVTAGQIFNSGYTGFTFFVKGVKCIVIEQSGKVGLEDQYGGYMEVMVNGNTKRIAKHRDRRFGDVNLDENELEKAYDSLAMHTIELLKQEGVI